MDGPHPPTAQDGHLSAAEVDALYAALKRLLAQMTAEGGRDTERDLFWQSGGYKTVMSKNTAGDALPGLWDDDPEGSVPRGQRLYVRGCQAL